MNKYIDALLFILVPFMGYIFILHGTEIVDSIHTGKFVPIKEVNIVSNIIGLPMFILFQIIRKINIAIESKLIICIFIAVLTSLVIQYYAVDRSIYMLFDQAAIVVSLIVVMFIEPCLRYDLSKEFWFFVFDGLFKISKFVLTLYVAGMAAFRFILEGQRSDDFIAEFVYHTGTLFLVFFIIGVWVLVPAWKKQLDIHKEIDSKNIILK